MADQQCTRCKKLKAVELFGRFKDGTIRYECNECNRQRSQEYRDYMLSDPIRAAGYKQRQLENGRRWAKNNLERKRKASREQKARLRAQGLSDKEYTKAWRKANPDKARKHHQNYMMKVQSDPERHAAYLEVRRINYRLRKEAEGIEVRRVRPRVPAKDKQMRVPVEPLQSFLVDLSKERGLSHGDIGRATGVHPDQIRHILKAKYKRVVISTVDKCLTTYGGPPLRSLYPDL